MNAVNPIMKNQAHNFAINTRTLNLWYGTFQALFDVDLGIKEGIITSLIGPPRLW